MGDKVQNTKFEFFLVIFGATLSRRFARHVFFFADFFHVFFVLEGPDKVEKTKKWIFIFRFVPHKVR